MPKILILGGYGNFGKRVARLLAHRRIPAIIAGRDAAKAEAVAMEIGGGFTASAFDVRRTLAEHIRTLRPKVVVNTCGPFQSTDYSIAGICIAEGVHYVDLADARDFVGGFDQLDANAKAAGTIAISGASTVPCLSSAVIEHFLGTDFSSINTLNYGISTGQRTERGVATAKSILSYAGQSLRPFAGHPRAYGWQDIHRQDYPELGRRWMANCEVPDLDILPSRYGIRSIRFAASMEMAPVHFSIWALGWLVRCGLPVDLPRFAPALLSLARLLDVFGSDKSGMHMVMRGLAQNGEPLERRWFIIARDGFGPFIPAVPAALLAERLAAGTTGLSPGAYDSAGLITLDDYLFAIQHLPIHTVTQ